MTPKTSEDVSDVPFGVSLRTLFAIMAAAITLTAGATAQYLSLRYAISSNRADIMVEIAKLQTSIVQLQSEVKAGSSDKYTGQDLLRLATAFRAANPSIATPDPVILRDSGRVQMLP